MTLFFIQTLKKYCLNISKKRLYDIDEELEVQMKRDCWFSDRK